MDVRGLGTYIREQRRSARLTLKGLSGLTGVSMPYLSQVERGLRKPSADILQGIAKGLRISAETLYVKAGILEDRPVHDVTAAIMGDLEISERQKAALIQIYEAFRDEMGRSDASGRSGRSTARSAAPKASPAPVAPEAPRRPPASRKATSSKQAKAASAPRSGSRARARTSKEA
jgi:transcriptional regulator with XRE-family HTH domain